MIIKENQLFSMFDRMQNNYQPILLYGPNEGLIRENVNKIKGIFKTDSLEVISFTGKYINEQPKYLMTKYKLFQCFTIESLFL